MKNGIKTLATWLIIGVIFIVLLSSIMTNTNTKLKYSELIAKINEGKVESIVIDADGTSATVQLSDEKVKKQVNIPNMENFMNYTDEFIKNGAFTLEESSESVFSIILGLLTPFGILIIFFIFWFFMMGGLNGSQNGGKTMTFGKSKARMMTPADRNKITFDDVAGVDEEKEELEEKTKEIVMDLKKFNKEEKVIKSRILLYTIARLLGSTKGIEKIHIEDVIKMCSNNIGNKYLTPNKNIKILLKNHKIYFISQK